MALLIQDDDIRAVTPMAECIEAMEFALGQHARGVAPFYPRRVTLETPTSDEQRQHSFTAQIGAVSGLDVAAVRLMSNSFVPDPHVARDFRSQDRRRDAASRDWGVVVLFSLTTGELLSIMPQFTLSGLRVGATTAVAVKHLARDDASMVGVLGSSKVSRADLEAVAEVRQLGQVKVYSPNPEHREEFAKDMSERLGVEVVPVNDAATVVRGSDVVCVSTNSNRAVFDADLLVPGQLVTSTKSTPSPRQPLSRSLRATQSNPEPMALRTEVDLKIFERSDAICILSEEMVLNEDQRMLLDEIDAGRLSWEKIYELGDVIVGNSQARQRPEDLIFYASTGGMGIQMAAMAAVTYRNARAAGVGKEIDAEWLSSDVTSWHERGYFPSP